MRKALAVPASMMPLRNTLITVPIVIKEHRRATDIAADSKCPQKLHGVPVGLMFFEGAPRLIKSGVTIPHQQGGPDRIVIEAYPGIIARNLIGRRSYKNDIKCKRTADRYEARKVIFAELAKISP